MRTFADGDARALHARIFDLEMPSKEPLAKLLAAGAGKEAIYVGYIKYKSSIIV